MFFSLFLCWNNKAVINHWKSSDILSINKDQYSNLYLGFQWEVDFTLLLLNTFSLPKLNTRWQIVSILCFRPPNTSLYYEFGKHENCLEWLYICMFILFKSHNLARSLETRKVTFRVSMERLGTWQIISILCVGSENGLYYYLICSTLGFIKAVVCGVR